MSRTAAIGTPPPSSGCDVRRTVGASPGTVTFAARRASDGVTLHGGFVAELRKVITAIGLIGYEDQGPDTSGVAQGVGLFGRTGGDAINALGSARSGLSQHSDGTTAVSAVSTPERPEGASRGK
ncbi:hypothetical protein [Mycolicibacterium sp.]|uniref:hypothetical protein n=1 Tax=Mycolicibacterium sp. TaxID=2320850 RepID=UPI00355E58A3